VSRPLADRGKSVTMLHHRKVRFRLNHYRGRELETSAATGATASWHPASAMLAHATIATCANLLNRLLNMFHRNE
jgi:hypothetical protein